MQGKWQFYLFFLFLNAQLSWAFGSRSFPQREVDSPTDIAGEIGIILQNYDHLNDDSIVFSVDPFQLSPIQYNQEQKSVPPGYLEWGKGYLLKSREGVSSAVRIMGSNIDEYFSGELFKKDQNDSYILLRLSQKFSEGGEYESDLDLKFRLDLPGTKERYRFVLSYQADEDETLEERNRPSEIADSQENKSFFAGLVRVVGDATKEWEHKLSAGIKAKLPPDPFVRIGTRRQYNLDDKWETDIRFESDWFNSRGFSAGLDWRFERLISEDLDLLFRSNTPLDYREEHDYFEFGQVFSIFHFWTETEAAELQLGVFGTSLSHSKINTYYFSLSYRNNIYDDWFFFNLIPELAFERENQFSGILSITAGFEMFFF